MRRYCSLIKINPSAYDLKAQKPQSRYFNKRTAYKADCNKSWTVNKNTIIIMAVKDFFHLVEDSMNSPVNAQAKWEH